MITVEDSIVINRPIEEVFAYVATDFFETAPTWAPFLQVIKPTSDLPIGVGATALGRGKPYQWKLQVLEYEPQRKFVMMATAAVIQNTLAFTFEPIAEGTRLICASTGDPIGLWRLAESLMTGSVERGNVCVVNNLKDQLESKKVLPAE